MMIFLLQLLGPHQLGTDVVDSEQTLPEPQESSTEPNRTIKHQQENVYSRESFFGGTNLPLLEPAQPLVRVTVVVYLFLVAVTTNVGVLLVLCSEFGILG